MAQLYRMQRKGFGSNMANNTNPMVPFADWTAPSFSQESKRIQTLRDDSLSVFKELGLPNRRVEEWKYTDLTKLAKKSFGEALAFEGGVETTSPFEKIESYKVTFVNGFYREDMSDLAGLPTGVEIATLGDGGQMPEWAESILCNSEVPAGHSVLALNAALMGNGVVIRVAPGTKVEKPICLRFVNQDDGQSKSASSFLRNVVLVEEGATLSILESHEGALDADYFASIASQYIVHQGASVRHAKIQDDGGRATHLSTQLLNVGSEASFKGFYLNKGSETCRNEIHGMFDGERAYIQLDGVFLGAGTQHLDNTTFVNHVVPSCESSQIFKGVLDDSARGVYQGQVVVEKDAQHTDGRQLVKTLLLSDKAEIDAKPELKIFADDVKCAHGATTGDIDDEQLFYLQSRGIDEVTARSLLVEAFLKEVVERIDAEDIRDLCSTEIGAWLDAHGKGKSHGA